jgi:hypothetical protein
LTQKTGLVFFFLLFSFSILTMMAVASCSASRQTLPAEIHGSWEIDRQLDVGAIWSGSCIVKGVGIPINVGFHSIQFDGYHFTHPKLEVVSARDFERRYFYEGYAGLQKLGITAFKITVIDSDEPLDSRLDFLLVKDSDTLLVERCGMFYEAKRKGRQ